MSPELFKMFLYHLSSELNGLDINLPKLENYMLSHLLWADDLILVALDATSLQILLNTLNKFIVTGALGINITKTNVMVFNSSGRQFK